MDIYTLSDMTMALQSAQYGDVLLFNIKNNIPFTSAALINKGVTINITNDSGNQTVTLMVVSGGTFRHFTTGGVSINDIAMTVGPGVIIDGGDSGGGIQIFGSSCLLELDNCAITNCRSNLNGGGVVLQGNASRSRLVMNNVLIKNCQAVGGGGGVFASACDIEMNGGEITGNRASNTGGGISTVAGANTLGCTIAINGGKITGNSVTIGDAGGIGAFDAIVTIEGGEISDNTADGNGGGIFSFNQSGIVSLNALIIKNSRITDNTIRNFGGGISTQNELSEFTILNSTITGNKAVSAVAGSNQGAGIYQGGGLLSVIDTKVFRNEAGTSGGGIFVNLSSLIVKGSTEISENIAHITAGGIYGFQGVNIIVEENAKIINNHALCGNNPESTTSGGGGIALLAFGSLSTLTVRGNAIVSGNTSVSYGGGIWSFPNFGPEIIVNIEGAFIEGNTANYGGGISMGEISGFTPVLTIANAVIASNTALTDGGGIIAKGSLVSVYGSKIINNTAGRNGGGIFTDELSSVTVDAASTFGGNTAISYAYWMLENGGDSDIHRTHIFTDRFSSFIPAQTPPLEVWSFTNAYNNYDINYVRYPVKIVTVNFVEASNPSHILHTTTIDSFLGATVIVPPRSTFTDSDGTIWFLQPTDQPAQTVVLTDPVADYIVAFYYAMGTVSTVTVTENYVDTCGCQIMNPTQTIVELGGNYNKSAPPILSYTFLGYRINNGLLQTGKVNIIGVNSDTIVMFVYIRKCLCPCCCHTVNPCIRCCLWPCCINAKNVSAVMNTRVVRVPENHRR